MDLGEERIWSIYTMLTRIEAAFRSLKSELGLRPIFHQKQERGDAHIFISILAYHISHAIEEALKEKGDHRRWSTIKEALKSHTRVTVSLNTEKGLTYHIRVCTTTEAHHLDIYNKLGLNPIPFPKRRAVFGKVKRSDHKNS